MGIVVLDNGIMEIFVREGRKTIRKTLGGLGIFVSQ